ncbi:hypothetical protein GTA62_14615 [Roseobacter sp. HKCCD9010]|uniref:hypothetical protein n=1 Tax=unclassified Roseobacter TaxID=196798 RepID=UPI0014914140|nr:MULTISPECIES: hypothetical protein [unclassified Roseobacter]MBF9050657.1 hypothetical protein [Rhodobacterales bacterium HKCCD4356]NNV11925.1 hypothetical protein [Roseobacter sp. HKCCD7357]NNV16938.1 hypothetical protein [Roseobacter sp. HKCCD8768]NNV26167.1 hypothetical protein [Roseobacter sp. HKCCD8192]NNV30659.1 hypothetical protein [Roseobacter sp. HKCCD9061]
MMELSSHDKKLVTMAVKAMDAGGYIMADTTESGHEVWRINGMKPMSSALVSRMIEAGIFQANNDSLFLDGQTLRRGDGPPPMEAYLRERLGRGYIIARQGSRAALKAAACSCPVVTKATYQKAKDEWGFLNGLSREDA